MTILAVGGTGSRSEDWIFVGVVLAIAYVFLYPLFVLFKRSQQSRRIRKQLVTSAYKLPLKMTPVELSYIFSSKINQQHLFATLLDLANRSILVIRQKEGKMYVEPGPKVESGLTESESLLVDRVFEADRSIPVDQVISGYTSLKTGNEEITGSRSYVFWWLLRHQLRKRRIIENHMTGRYTKMLFVFGVISSLFISMTSIAVWRFIQMLDSGEVDFDRLCEHWANAFVVWLILLLPIIIVSFADLKFRGRMLGRLWLLTKQNRRYINQFIAFKEYVRLSNKKSLRFESKELEKESTINTKPYAIALGFTKEKSLTGK